MPSEEKQIQNPPLLSAVLLLFLVRVHVTGLSPKGGCDAPSGSVAPALL